MMKILLAFTWILLFPFFQVYGQIWNALGDGLNNEVLTIEIHNGDVYAGGLFTDAGGDPDADYLARWDGQQWHAVAPGLNYLVWAVAFKGDDIYVGGAFTDAGGNPNADHIAYWDGAQWNALGGGLNNNVHAITIDGQDIYAGGFFSGAHGSATLNYIARWNEGQWNPVGDGFNHAIYTIAVDGGFVYAGGGDAYEGGILGDEYIVRWDGSEWNSLGPGLDDVVTDIEIHDGRVYAGGLFPGYVANWKGGGWNYYNGGPLLTWGEVVEINVEGDNIYVAAFADGLHKWDGIMWTSLITEIPPIPDAVWTTGIQSGSVYVGGHFFLDVAGTSNIARFGGAVTTSAKDTLTISAVAIEVDPNPTTGILYYNIRNDKTILDIVTMTDLNGNTVFHTQTNERKVDITSLPQGIYFMQVKNEHTWGMAKVIKL